MTEIWRDVPLYDGLYEASTFGRLRSKARVVKKRYRNGRFVEQHYPARIIGARNPEGYYYAHISVNGVRRSVAVHRMVAMAFHGLPTDGQECCHNNGNPADNRPENLRWDTHLANNQDRHKHGNYASGLNHHQAKFPASLLNAIKVGAINKAEALQRGISHTHYYRVRKSAGMAT